MNTKRRNKKLFRKINSANLVISLGSVLVSFFIVSVCGAIQTQRTTMPQADSLGYSALRIADAFELYNQKRFNQ